MEISNLSIRRFKKENYILLIIPYKFHYEKNNLYYIIKEFNNTDNYEIYIESKESIFEKFGIYV